MDKKEKLALLQNLRDVAKRVQVAGKTETYHFSPAIISIICEMQLFPQAWIVVLDDEIKKLERS